MKLLLNFDPKTLKLFSEFIGEVYKLKPNNIKGILINFYFDKLFAMYSTLDDLQEKEINYNYVDYITSEPLSLYEYILRPDDNIHASTIKEYNFSFPGSELKDPNISMSTLKIGIEEFEQIRDFISSQVGLCQYVLMRVKSQKVENRVQNFLFFEVIHNDSARRTSSFEIKIKKTTYKMEHISSPQLRIMTVELENLFWINNVADKFKAKCNLHKVDLKEVNVIIQPKFNQDESLSLIFLYDSKTCEVINCAPGEESWRWGDNYKIDEVIKKKLFFSIQMNHFIDIFSVRSSYNQYSIIGFQEDSLYVFLSKKFNEPNVGFEYYSSYSIKLPAKLITNVKDAKFLLKNNEALMKIDNDD
jgi:hypothetical protein